jgi:hypothetical protein
MVSSVFVCLDSWQIWLFVDFTYSRWGNQKPATPKYQWIQTTKESPNKNLLFLPKNSGKANSNKREKPYQVTGKDKSWNHGLIDSVSGVGDMAGTKRRMQMKAKDKFGNVYNYYHLVYNENNLGA